MTLERSKADFSIVRRRFQQNTNMPNAEKYRFYGQHFPQLDEFIFKRYFPDTAIQGVFVECGANDGNAGSNCKFFEESLQWTGYNFEATPETFNMLRLNRPNATNICVALSDHCGTIPFALTESVEQNSKYMGAVNRVAAETSAAKAGDVFTVSGTDYRVSEVIEVPCLTWRELVARYSIPRVDLFILDTEGHEGAVLDGMMDCSVLPAIICVEDGWREEIRRRLDVLGYVYDISHFGNHMYIKKDLLSLFMLRGLHRNY